MTGDQVYVDDVAGPMLRAVHALIERLGLVDEQLEGATVGDSQALYDRPPKAIITVKRCCRMLTSNAALRERFFGGVQKAGVYLRKCAKPLSDTGRNACHVLFGMVPGALAAIALTTAQS